MRIALISDQPPLDPASAASGNQVRASQLKESLAHHGHEVMMLWRGEGGFQTPSDLASSLERLKADVLLVGYWKLLDWLPAGGGWPVVVDCVAPRPLEQHFADPATSDLFLARYLKTLERADLILVGNQRQRWMMAGWLLSTEIDLRQQVPVAVVPLAFDPPDGPRTGCQRPLIVVGGGMDWPWRQTDEWTRQLCTGLPSGEAELHCFGKAPENCPGLIEHSLASWQDWTDFLKQRAAIGIELSEPNLERELSQSHRTTSFLAAGLPVIVNDFLPLAELIRRHDAGWVVASADEAVQAATEAARDEALWQRKAAGAWQLGRAELDRRQVIETLIDWLATPQRRANRDTSGDSASRPTLAPQQGLTGRLAHRLLRPWQRQSSGDGVVMITRSDLFPADHGAAVKIIQTARGLARTGRRVAIVSAERSHWWQITEDGISRERLPLWLKLLAPPRALTHLIHRLRGLPASNAFLYWAATDPFYGLRAAWVGRQIKASIWLAEFPGYAQAARIARLLNGGHAVLAQHNVEYERLAEQVAGLGERQYQRLKSLELHLAACMDAVVCVSDRDRRRLIEDGLDPASCVTIPHGVDLAAFDQAQASDLVAEFGLDPALPVLVFHGTFSYPPNRQALHLLVEEILPRLEASGHSCQVLAIGRQPPRGLSHPQLHLVGSLDQLGGALKACQLAVVPLISGGGTRMKILDYFAAGLPVISTTKGCEGLPVADGEQLLVRDDWEGFAAAIRKLLDDAPQRTLLAESGHKLATSLDWGEIGARYDALFKRIAS